MTKGEYERLLGEEEEDGDLGTADNFPKGMPALCCNDCVQPDFYSCCSECCWNCGRTYRAGFEGFLTLKFINMTCGPESSYMTRTVSIVLAALWVPIFMVLSTIEGVIALLWIFFVDILWRFSYMLYVYLSSCLAHSCSHREACSVVNEEGRSYLPCFHTLAEHPGTELRCGLDPDFLC